MARFHGMTRFTIADFNKGYWMVELDPELRKYTMMALGIGRFQWTRLPMGSIIAQDVFQRKLDAIFPDIPGVTGIADDMVIYGKTDLEHDRHLINFLNICRKNTLMLNPDKMQFRLPQVSFFGHQWSAKGLSPDPMALPTFVQKCYHLTCMGCFFYIFVKLHPAYLLYVVEKKYTKVCKRTFSAPEVYSSKL